MRKSSVLEEIQTFKDICKQEIEKTNQELGIDLPIMPLTIIEYYDSDVFKCKTKLERKEHRQLLKNATGYYNPKGIYIFIDKVIKNISSQTPNLLIDILITAYHEYRHQLQYQNKSVSEYEKALISVERKIIMLKPNDYDKRHDQYFLEFDAELYAIEKTKEYFKTNYPESFNIIEKYIDYQYLSRVQIEHLKYDAQAIFDLLYTECTKKKVHLNYFKDPIFQLFYNKDNKYRPLNEIINSNTLKNVDIRIIEGILGSSTFLEQLDISKLELNEKLFILHIIDNVIKDKEDRFNKLETLYQYQKIRTKEYFAYFKSLIKKFQYLDEKYTIMYNSILDIKSQKVTLMHYEKLKKIQKELSNSIPTK